jgi:hypothetical protein
MGASDAWTDRLLLESGVVVRAIEPAWSAALDELSRDAGENDAYQSGPGCMERRQEGDDRRHDDQHETTCGKREAAPPAVWNDELIAGRAGQYAASRSFGRNG